MRQRLDEYEIPDGPVTTLEPEVLNTVLGRLLLPAQMTVLHGSEKAPLTLLCHAVVVAGSREEGRVAFLDSSSNYSPSLIRKMAPSEELRMKILHNTLVTTTMSLEDLLVATESLYDVESLTIIIVDSLTQMLNMSSGPMTAGRQRRLFMALESIRALVNQKGCHVLFTDHSARSWNRGVPRPIGGNVLEHAVDSFVRVDRLENESSLIRILVERSPAPSPNEAVVVRQDERGLTCI